MIKKLFLFFYLRIQNWKLFPILLHLKFHVLFQKINLNVFTIMLNKQRQKNETKIFCNPGKRQIKVKLRSHCFRLSVAVTLILEYKTKILQLF